MKFVITGAPGTGKTTIIKNLKKKGFYCAEEVSRELINEQISNGGEILPWKNQISFENEIANRRSVQYLESPKDCICFFERSSIDCIAYLHANNLESTSGINTIIKNQKFNKHIFYTPIWKEIYKNDSQRKESFEQAIKIEKHIKNSYRRNGYTLIEIPKESVKYRVDFVLSTI